MNSCFVICQSVLSVMSGQGYGSIVNIASIYGVVGNDFTLYEEYGGTSPAAYCAIKGGIINFPAIWLLIMVRIIFGLIVFLPVAF